MRNKVYLILSILMVCLFSFCCIILFDIYINRDIDTHVENFRVSKNKILAYSMLSGKRKSMYDIDYHTEIYTNKQGFRDVDFDTKKGNVKILCFGDSITFGEEVETKALYTNVLSDFLGKNYSVYNFGVNGYNTIQEAENLKVNGLKYKPDIVVFLYCLNDMDPCCDPYAYYASKASFCRLHVFLCKSGIYRRYVFLPIIRFIDYLQGEDRTNVVEMYKKYGTTDISNVEYNEIGVKIISELQKQYGFKCYFFIVPYFRNFDNYLKMDESIHNIMKEISRKYLNIKFVDLKDNFMNISMNPEVFVETPLKSYMDYVHPNEYGHELIAKFIYEQFKVDGILENK